MKYKNSLDSKDNFKPFADEIDNLFNESEELTDEQVQSRWTDIICRSNYCVSDRRLKELLSKRNSK